jgi:site-specific recombinase XerD
MAPLEEPITPDEAELAAASFLARYSRRTLDAYRHDLRGLFQWAVEHGLPVLEATRAHLEMYRASMEERALAASTIDRRLSTACGFYRFAHIDGRIASNPAQYVRRPTVHPSDRRGLDRGELGRFLFAAERFDNPHAALSVLLGLNGLRGSEACATNIEDMAFERGHRVLRIVGKGNVNLEQPGEHAVPDAPGVLAQRMAARQEVKQWPHCPA